MQENPHDPKLLDQLDNFQTPISIGTPAQNFLIQLDTSSYYTWVPSIGCNNCIKSQAYFLVGNSSTLESQVESTELSLSEGDLSGNEAKDTFIWNSLKVPNFNFLLIKSFSEDYTDSFDGKIGLAFKHPKGDNYLVVNALKTNKLIKDRAFFISFNQKNVSLPYYDLSFNLGIYPEDYEASDYSSCKVLSHNTLSNEYKYGWLCSLSHIIIGSSSISLDNAIEVSSTVIFDSSRSNIYAPQKMRSLFLSNLDPSCKVDSTDDFSYILCPRTIPKKSFSLVIGGSSYTINDSELFSDFDQDYNLFNIFFSGDSENVWTLGLIFFKHYDTIFDYDKAKVSMKGKGVTDLTNIIAKYDEKKKQEELAQQRYYLIIALSSIGFFLVLIIILLAIRSRRRSQLEESKNLVSAESNH